MKKAVAWIATVALLVMLAVIFLRVGVGKGYLGAVSIAVRSYSTNANGKVSALVSITNGGRHVINLGIGTQVRQAEGWVDSGSGLSNAFSLKIVPAVLPPSSNVIMSVDVPVATRPWRVYALCQKQYEEHWSKPLRLLIDGYVLKRGIVEHFYGEEIAR